MRRDLLKLHENNSALNGKNSTEPDHESTFISKDLVGIARHPFEHTIHALRRLWVLCIVFKTRIELFIHKIYFHHLHTASIINTYGLDLPDPICPFSFDAQLAMVTTKAIYYFIRFTLKFIFNYSFMYCVENEIFLLFRGRWWLRERETTIAVSHPCLHPTDFNIVSIFHSWDDLLVHLMLSKDDPCPVRKDPKSNTRCDKSFATFGVLHLSQFRQTQKSQNYF